MTPAERKARAEKAATASVLARKAKAAARKRGQSQGIRENKNKLAGTGR